MRCYLAVVGVALASCATGQMLPLTPPPMAGLNWEVRDLVRQDLPEDSEQTRWHYVLRLRDSSGTGLHLTRLTRSFPGVDTHGVSPQSASIDLRIEPNGVLDLPCWETLFLRSGGHPVNFDLHVRKTFSGQDGSGRNVTFFADLPFESRGRAQPARLLEFARFTARESSRIPQPHYCETAPNGIREVDRTQADHIYFLIGIRIVYRLAPTQLRTRWIDPAGDVVKVIDSGLRHLAHTSGWTLNVHATHSIPRELFRDRPGEWKVELFVDGQHEGVYAIRVV